VENCLLRFAPSQERCCIAEQEESDAWAVVEPNKFTKQSHLGSCCRRALVFGPALPLLQVSSASRPYSSAGFNVKEYCREGIAQ
jgi:hypothetical protein